jgi:hypothetical protein
MPARLSRSRRVADNQKHLGRPQSHLPAHEHLSAEQGQDLLSVVDPAKLD